MFSLIIFLPLFSSICTGFFGYKIGTKGVALVTFSSLLSVALLSVYCLCSLGFKTVPLYINLLPWITVGNFSSDWALCFDGLSILMFLLVTVVSTLVYLYVCSVLYYK